LRFLCFLHVCDWWFCMNDKEIENLEHIERLEEDKIRLDKIVDKLEQRIATLEKVLQSHAKCIGEMREENFIPIRKDQIESIEKELNK